MPAALKSDPQYFSCMGRNYSCAVNSPLDPDIAGVGVIVAFLATALITFAAILIGYVAKCLPGVSTNDLDQYYVNKIQEIFGHQPTDDANDNMRLKTKHMREEVLERFVLALSDQQLVTGLAVLIAAFLKCDISVYSFGIVTSVAWFSCTTHLFTLIVLKRYLLDHPVVLRIRICGMLLIAVLLLTAEVISYIGISEASLENVAMHCALHSRGSFGMIVILLNLFPITIWLPAAYVNRLAAIYVKTRTDPLRSWVYHYAMLKADANFVPPARVYSRAKAIDRIRLVNEEPGRSNWILNWLELIRFAYVQLISSFLWELIWLFFALIYGISQLVVAWIQAENQRRGSLFVMGFGQMVPIILLVLPVLAGLEVFYEVKEKPKLRHASDDGTNNTNTENTLLGEASLTTTEIEDVPSLEALETPAPTIDPSGGDSVAERQVPLPQETTSSQDNSTADFNADEIISESHSAATASSRPSSLHNSQTEIVSDSMQSSIGTVNSTRYLARIGASRAEYQHPARTTTIELSQMEQGSTGRRTGLHLTSPSPAHDLQRPNQRTQTAMLNLPSTLESNGNNFYLIPHFRFVLATLIAVHVLMLIYFTLAFSRVFILISNSEGATIATVIALLIPLLIVSPRLDSVLTEIKDVYSAWRARTVH